MLETRESLEKKFNKDNQRLIGEVQLQQYSNFFERYHKDATTFTSKLKRPLCANARPITISITPKEDITLLELVSCEDKLLSRILLSLSSLCNEVQLLLNEARDDFYNQIVYYGEEESGIDGMQQLDKLFALLQRIYAFVQRSRDVIVLILRQLCAIVGKKYYSDGNSSAFPEMFECLAKLLVCLLTLEMLLSGGAIHEHWRVYRRAVKAMSHSSHELLLDVRKVYNLNEKLLEIEDELLTGLITKRTIDRCLEDLRQIAAENCNLSNEMQMYVQEMLQELEKDEDSLTFIELWLQLNVLFALYVNISGALDKKLVKRLLDVNKKVSACVVGGNIVWIPEQFLMKHIPSFGKSLDLKAIVAHRQAQITQRSNCLQKDVNSICAQACLWFITFEKRLKEDTCKYKVKDLNECCNLFIDGMKLIKKVSESIKWITNMHAEEGRPMPKSVLLSLCKMIEILISFQFVFRRNILPLSYIILLISQQLTHKALAIVSNIKKGYKAEKSYKQQQLDVISAINVVEKALNGPNTFERILVAKLALSSSGLENEVLSDIRVVIQRLDFVCNLLNILNTITDCSFLYWHQVLFPVYFNKISTKGDALARSYLLLSALSHSTEFSENSRLNAMKYVQKSLVEPLREQIEANLRHQTHLHLQLNALNPFETALPTNSFKLSPIRFTNDYIDMKNDVEHYLSTMFYNLTTVVLHDWRTYGEMRRLALLQYGLHTVEDNLPVQTLEQGLDVLEIMRNINVFVAKYVYNLNTQVFVEECSAHKHLNTINISHVANSIRSHGIGIMSTTINFTYQFLQKKFYTFSQFMFDEQIKSRLLKDLRYFNEHKVELSQMYPYARAEAFNYGIRKLGVNESGHTYLDLFRKLITQIGNAMGYVRLIRSGGKRCIADGTSFLPNLQNIDEMNAMIANCDLPELTTQAALHLKREINNLAENFEEATEYFKLLINAFAPVFRDPQNVHMRNFYAIIPPLTINYVEYALNCKERLNKHNRDGGVFTDDGFAMGIAYIIELLDLGSQLDSLHWFQAVRLKQTQQWKLVEEQRTKDGKEDKLQQTLSLTEKRIKSIEMEFKLLYYSFSSARIFFQAS